MTQPCPLSNPFLRRVVGSAILGGLLVIASYVVLAVVADPGRLSAWGAVTGLVIAYGYAVMLAIMGYSIGWNARAQEEHTRVAGHWLAYPMDEDGVPTHAPVVGRLVLDEPGERP